MNASRMKIWMGLGLGLWLGASWAGAEGSYPNTVKGVLERFLTLDAQAAGLASQTWPEIARYTTWTTPPAWDRFVVIDRYSIGKILQGSTRAQAVVTYQPIGQLSDKFVPNSKPETVTYHLNKVKGEWRIDDPIAPHVSYDVMRRRLETASAADPKVKNTNDELIRQIDAARQALR